MSTNIIIASILTAIQKVVDIERQNADPILASGMDWAGKARALISGIPNSPTFSLADYLVTNKGYTPDDVSAVAATMALLEAQADMATQVSNPDADLSPYWGDASIKPDADIVATIIGNFAPLPNQSTAPQPAQAAPVPPGLSIDPNMAKGIDAILTAASNGQIKSINDLLREKSDLTIKLSDAQRTVIDMQMKASQPVLPTTGTVASPVGPLTFDVVYKKANDCFLINGKKAGQGLAFDVPTLVWKDSAGTIVEHPETPAIDVNYDFNPVQILLFLTAMNRNMNSWLFGHTGTGKSTFVEQVAARIGWPVSRVNLDSNLERADLVGHVSLTEQNGTTISVYEEGILPRAMQRPGFLLMDEIDAGRPDILFVVQRALEGKGLMLTEDGGRIVAPHPLFRFAATANTRGQGDEYGMYQGTRAMNASMIDRFTAFIEFDYMDPKREAALLLKKVPALDPGIANQMAQFAKEIRVAFAKGEVYNTISPRGLDVLGGAYVTFTGIGSANNVALQMAMDMSILNKVTNDTKQKFIEIATRVFGMTVPKAAKQPAQAATQAPF